MALWPLFAASLLCSLAIALPAYDYVVHEVRKSDLAAWHKHRDINREVMINFTIALTQTNLDKAHEELMKVADPSSKTYGQHWTEEAVSNSFAPTTKSIDEVQSWLKDVGIIYQPETHGVIKFTTSIQQAEELFRTQYAVYEHMKTHAIHLAATEYSVPASLQEHIDLVMPTVHFDAIPKNNKHATTLKRRLLKRATKPLGTPGGYNVIKPKIIPIPPAEYLSFLPGLNRTIQTLSTSQCGSKITPACLRALYSLPYNIRSNAANSFGIVDNFTLIPSSTEPKLISIDNAVVQTTDQGFEYNAESDLDLEYGMSLVYPQEVTLYQVGDLVKGASFNNLLFALDKSYCFARDETQDSIYTEDCSGNPKPRTKVISTSYGYNEADLPELYQRRQCDEYMKLGLLGTSILYTSGDYGVAGNGNQCIDPITGSYNDGRSGRFNPTFPATCPYVTAVGATQIVPGGSVTQPERACETVIYSGGGFSNIYALPSYQSSSVKSYYTKYKPAYTAAQYNNSMNVRGVPDISANGANYLVASDGGFSLVYGTSCSSPVVGAIVTLLNQARLDVSKVSLGFLNPLLYANPGAFNDITSGSNPGCGTSGFSAVPGWDPITGLGTPNYPRLLKLALNLP